MTIYYSALGNHGHLGNQMFQYASLRGIASNMGYSWAIPAPETFGTKYALKSNIHELFTLDSFGVSNIMNFTPDKAIGEKSFAFDENIFNNCPDGYDIYGYFQSYKYFEGIENEIRKDFSFKNQISMSDEFNVNDMVGIHIRRTDYLANSVLNVLSESYYKKAIDMFPDQKFIIFSDDISWCQSQQIFKSDRFHFSKNNPYVDFYLLSHCHSAIIANSSFSWWAAWLNKSAEKIVAPKNWIVSGTEDYKEEDLLLPDWIVI